MIMRKAPIKNSTVASAMALYGILGGLFLNWKRNKNRRSIMKTPRLRCFKAGKIIRTNLDALCVLKEVLLLRTALGEKGKGQAGGEALLTALTVTQRSPDKTLLFPCNLIPRTIHCTVRKYFLTKTKDTLRSFTD